jgi:hypothetical protein
MSTPAAQALSGANAGAASSGGTGSGTPASGGASGVSGSGSNGAGLAASSTGAANQNAFWNSWNLPDQKETREWVQNKNYDSPFTLAKTAQQLEREAATLRAGKGYPVPGADGKVDPNAQKAWNALTGVPETADKYDIPVPEGNPYPQFKGFMQEALHKAGVPAAMAPALARGYEEAVQKMEAQIRETENATSAQQLLELQTQWGAQYQERVALAQRGKEWLSKEVGGLSELQLRSLESVLTTPKFMAAMWKIGAGNGEARFAGNNADGGGGFTGGASEAQIQLDRLMADRSAGTIKDHQWREISKPGGQLDQLRDRIVAGMAPLQ